MGKIVMPKNSALLNEVESVLEIYYEVDDWLENSIYKDRLKEMIGEDQYSSSYTKKAQITSYFGFTIWEDFDNPQSMRRITESGKRMYEAIRDNNVSEIQDVLMDALENVKFGRDNCGCPDSDSDIEPPSLFVRAVLDLDYLSYKEFAYLLWKLEDIGANYSDSIQIIKNHREANDLELGKEATKYLDCKPIMVLVRWGFLDESDKKNNGAKQIIIHPEVLSKYNIRLKNLKIYNIDMDLHSICSPLDEYTDNFNNKDCKNKEYTKSMFLKDIFIDEADYDKLKQLLLYKKNIILQGPPGVGKTYLARKLAYSILGRIDDSYVESIQFHQSYSYEDFVMGYKPYEDGFILSNGVFYNFCKAAEIDDNINSKYFFLIDEINRGNLSKIFGELMSLIEVDKRGHAVRLAYKDELFSVPPNVYVIGLMNTADRGLAMIDYALRRRFSFFDISPAFNSCKFKKHLENNIQDSHIVDAVIENLGTLNEKICDVDNSGLGKGFCVGHSYFCSRPSEGQTDIDWYNSIIDYEIVPLLEEYWWDDKDKINDWKQNLHAIKK